MAYVADSAPERPVWLASVVVSKAPMLGLTLGALVSGAVVETSPNARIVVYVVMTALLVVCLGFILAVAETGTRRPGLGASLRPRIHLPRRSRAQVPVMACIVTATWAVGGWFQAFGPAVTAEQLHTSNAVVVALVFSSIHGSEHHRRTDRWPVGRGGRTAARHDRLHARVARAARRAGGGDRRAVPDLFSHRGCGAGHRHERHGARDDRRVRPAARASILTAVFVASYAGAMVASLVAGQLTRVITLPTLTAGYVVLALLATMVTIAHTRKNQTHDDLATR
ncbi:membrane hypothetical protein [Nostocoides australiense Ben110]|uniref:Uncharacterized protein n=1 Tax=Nostocoides australiense Ben110 TaxID=1193182 RepID=W6JZJ6_9MICO|nr:membrane hypothetical protein [Tetrasphaera australiensis Ben110]